MRTILNSFLIVVFLISFSMAQKALYIEQKSTTPPMMGQPGKTDINKTWLMEDRIRVEGSDNITIFRLDKGVVWNANKKTKEYFEMTVEQMEAMAQMGRAMLQGDKEMDFKVTKTDETKKIGKWNCYKVIAASQMMTQTMWFSEEIPFDKNVYYKFFKNMPEAKKLAELMYKQEQVKGFPVLTETEVNMMGMKITSTSELIKINEANPPAGSFDLPDGFNKTENPMEQMKKHQMK